MAGGLSGAIHRLAGTSLRDHCDNLPPLTVGTAIVTPGFDSPFQWIVHAHTGNNFTHPEPWCALAQTLMAALKAADSACISSLCCSAFGTGPAQIPAMAAAAITMRTLSEVKASLKNLNHVKFCVNDPVCHGIYIGAARVWRLVKN